MIRDGFINMLKPPGMSSSDLVVAVRRLLPRGMRVGHGGTLDPDAAGVLPVCVGRATRLFDYIIDKQKRYVALLRLGVETDTQDASGRVLARRDASGIGPEDVKRAFGPFIGEIDQTPPAYSAIKQGGVRMYDLARSGAAPALEPRRVTVDEIGYIAPEGEDGHLIYVCCRKGVYIRTLCHDIGRALGVGGHMAALLRTAAGSFDIASAVTVERLAEAGPEGLNDLIVPMDAPLGHYRAIRIDEALRPRAVAGTAFCPGEYESDAAPGETVRVYVGGRFSGMAALDESGTARFRANFTEK